MDGPCCGAQGREFSATNSVFLMEVAQKPPSEGLMPMTVITTRDATLLDNLEIDLGVSRGHDEDKVAVSTLLDDESESQICHKRATLGGSSATVASCEAVPASANAVDCGRNAALASHARSRCVKRLRRRRHPLSQPKFSIWALVDDSDHGPRLYVCQAPNAFICVSERCASQTPNAFICVSPNAFICVSPNAFICVSPNAFICVSPNAFICVSPNVSV